MTSQCYVLNGRRISEVGEVSMDSFLFDFAMLALLVCLIGFFNEKVTKVNYEIALMLFSAILGIVLVIGMWAFSNTTSIGVFLRHIEFYDLEGFLVKGVLCFMLFAGSCHHKVKDIKNSIRHISVLAFVCTLLGAFFYAALFYGGTKLLGINLSIPVCLMFGSIVAPSDPIAATGILKKFGLPKKISFLIETEALFNDGVGVALFVCFSGMVSVKAGASQGFLEVMLQQVLGAAAVAVVITAVCFLMFKYCKNNILRIMISLLNVSMAYFLCEEFKFSGALSAVICGILFATLRSKYMENEDEKDEEIFNSFWETLDGLFNSLLYVMLGLSFVVVLQMHDNMVYVLALSVIAIVANLISRALGLSISSLFMGPLPDNYDKGNFVKLFTWAGLRGGLSVALAMSTKPILNNDKIYFIILGSTFAIVFFTTVIQGLTMTSVYNRISASVLEKQGKAS